MDADIKGCLLNINKSYRIFEHNGMPMNKKEVKTILEYGLKCGYETTNQIPEAEVYKIIKQIRQK